MDQDRPRRLLYLLLAIGLLALIAAAVGVAVARPRHHHHAAPAPASASASTADQNPSWAPSTPTLPGDIFVSWAYLDSTEGDMMFGGDSEPRPLGQLIVPGAAEHYLDHLGSGQSPSPQDTAVLTSALAQNLAAGTQIIAMAGGADQVVPRIIDACRLASATPSPPQATAVDVVHYAACLREGALIAPDRAGWVLDQMRQTAGGIGDVRGNDGGQRLAQFNTTEPAGDGMMRTACMGIGPYWSAAVFVDWPADRGVLYGVSTCSDVAAAQFPPDTQQAPDPSPTPAEDPSTA